MFQVLSNVLVCAVVVPLLYIELYFDVPLMKALVLSIDLGLGQQLAFVFIFFALFSAPIKLAALGPSVRILERLWPATAAEEMSRRSSFTTARSETLRHRWRWSISSSGASWRPSALPRHGTTGGQDWKRFARRRLHVLSDIEDFLATLGGRHPMQSVDDHSSMLTRRNCFPGWRNSWPLCAKRCRHWTTNRLVSLCERVSARGSTRSSLSLLHAIDTGDEDFWTFSKELTGDRSELMRKMRNEYWKTDPPLDDAQHSRVIAITSSVEQIFFLLSKLVKELDDSPILSTRVLVREYAQSPIR